MAVTNINIIEFKLSTPLAKWSYDNKVTVPFELVYQTNNKKIEKEVIVKYPFLLDKTIMLTPQQKLKTYEMDSFIKKSLSIPDMTDIHQVLYDRKWMDQISINQKLTEIQITKAEAGMWSDITAPYLEIKGTITLDIIKLFNYYLKNNLIEFKSTNGFFSERPSLEFKQDLPFILRITQSQTPYDIIVKEVQKQLNTQNSDVNKIIESKTKLKNFHTFKTISTWDYSRKKISIEIQDRGKLIKSKAFSNPLTYGLLGFGATKIMEKSSPNVVSGIRNYLKGKN